jgi:hypothetical protein
VEQHYKDNKISPAKSRGVSFSEEVNDVVDSGKEDLREQVELRPHMLPQVIGKHKTRFARRGRGKSPGSYREAKPMSEYNKRAEKAPWAKLQTKCKAPQRDSAKTCTRKSRRGSKFCSHPECQSNKHGIPDYAADPAYNTETEQDDSDEEYIGPLPEALRKPLLWVWGNFYTPFSWMVVWVFSVMQSSRGIFGQAIVSPYHLMKYCTHSIACKWKWKQAIAILSQAMSRQHPLLGVGQVLDVLGSHEQTRHARVIRDPNLNKRIMTGIASCGKNGRWSGRNGAKWFKEAKKKWDTLVTARWEGNLLKAYLDPTGVNARCFGLADLTKEDGTPNFSAGKRKFGKALITMSELKKASRKVPQHYKSTNYEFCITKPAKMTLSLSAGSKFTVTYDMEKFIEVYIGRKTEKFASTYDAFYLVDTKARKPRGSKNGLVWVEDPVIIQCAAYSDGGVGKLFLGVGRKTASGFTGPFESLFLRTRGRTPFTHVWDADDELDVMEASIVTTTKVAEDDFIARLESGETMTLEDLMTLS